MLICSVSRAFGGRRTQAEQISSIKAKSVHGQPFYRGSDCLSPLIRVTKETLTGARNGVGSGNKEPLKTPTGTTQLATHTGKL